VQRLVDRLQRVGGRLVLLAARVCDAQPDQRSGREEDARREQRPLEA
jgi:hypothetical protein